MRGRGRRAILFLVFLHGITFSQIADEVGEAVEDGDGAQPLAVVDGRIAADRRTGGDVVGDSALRGGDGSVADGAVAGDTDLAGEDNVFADDGGAGEADLSTEKSVFAYG